MLNTKSYSLTAVMAALLSVITYILGPQWAILTHLPGGVLIVPLSGSFVALVLALGVDFGATVVLTLWSLLLIMTPAIGFAPGIHKVFPAFLTGLLDDIYWRIWVKCSCKDSFKVGFFGVFHTIVMWTMLVFFFWIFGVPAYMLSLIHI